MEKPSKNILIGIAATVLLAGFGIYYFVIRKKNSDVSETAGAEPTKADNAAKAFTTATVNNAQTGVASTVAPASVMTGSGFTSPEAAAASAAPFVQPYPETSKTLVVAPGIVPNVTKAPESQSLPQKVPAPVGFNPAPAPITPAPTPTQMPAGIAKMLRVVEDGAKHKAILRVSPKNLFAVGNTVKVNGSVYKGSYKIWYIYKAHATEDALYIETPFAGNDYGTVSK